MPTRKKASKVVIKKGRKKRGPSAMYPFDTLKTKGNYFDVLGKDVKYDSIRTQASKQGARRSVKYKVEKIEKGVRVWFDHYVDPPTTTVKGSLNV